MKTSPTANETHQEKTVSSFTEEDTGAICPTCCGTGLVCGIEPAVTPGACCVDYANAFCPACGGRGRKP